MVRIRIELPEKCLATFNIPIRITDINYGNHVGNNALVEVIHEARMQFLQEHDFTELEAAGTALIMNELLVEFKSEAFYKDILEVKIFAGEMSRVGFEIYYSISTTRNNQTFFIAKAKTGMVCFNYKEKTVESIPVELKNILSH
ncbi:MAG: thioesterase family protein [Bacteroidota bacterium]|nr:thioesterase family protein [Bacteroidota bacterium]